MFSLLYYGKGFGVIGSAVVFGIMTIQFIKRSKLKDYNGQTIIISTQEPGYARNLIGGTIFGLGWAITGACLSPLFILVGYQGGMFIIAILGAIAGTFTYGVLQKHLPH
jgi:uncharacterized membrane protein YedE/YeeE